MGQAPEMEREMNTRQDMDRARAQIEAEIRQLAADRDYKAQRLERLRAHTALPGCEARAERAKARYKAEISEINRRIGMLEANLEGLA